MTIEARRRMPYCVYSAAIAAVSLFAVACGSADGMTEETADGTADGAADGTEHIGVVQSEFTGADCAMAAPDVVFEGKIEPAHVSPRSYNSCYKGYIVEVNYLLPEFTGTGNVQDATITVEYADTPITDQATCEGTKLVAHYWELERWRIDGQMFYAYYSVRDTAIFGTWVPAFDGGVCLLNDALTGLHPYFPYRIAATIRTPSNATRALRIGTYRPVTVY